MPLGGRFIPASEDIVILSRLTKNVVQPGDYMDIVAAPLTAQEDNP